MDNRIIAIDLNENRRRDYIEIMVPTASYRMGVKHIGHGFAIIGKFKLVYSRKYSIKIQLTTE